MAIEDKAVMPLADYKAACDAIRAKKGTDNDIVSGQLASEIESISTGTDISATTATAANVLKGKYFYTAQGALTEGTIPSTAAQTFYPQRSGGSIADRSIAAGRYTSGRQLIKDVYISANLIAANIKKGVTIQIGDSDNNGRLISITGTYDGSSPSPTPTTKTASGTFSGDGSSSYRAYYSSMSSGVTIVSWSISASSNYINALYSASGTASSGSGTYCKTPPDTGGSWEYDSVTVTCSPSSGGIVFSCGSPAIFSSGVTYSWSLTYRS